MSLPRDVILFSTADWASAFWTNKQHLACGLARAGFRVLYVESLGLRRPTVRGRDLSRLARRLARGLRPIRQVRPGIWVFSPWVVPFHGLPFCRRLNESVLSAGLRLATGWLGFQRPMIWTYHPVLPRALDRLSPSLLVYHCVDRLAAAPHMPVELIDQSERELLRSADVVFATSRALQAHCSEWGARAAYYHPNVADFDHFARARLTGPIPPDLAVIPRPRLGFIGAVSDYKVDFALIAAIARQRPDWHWVLIGQVGEGQPWTSIEQLRRPNIHLLGPRSYDVLPEYLRGLDVVTIPAATNAYTAAMFPMKFFEYLAAGRPVVATEVPALAEFAVACRLAGTVDAFRDALVDALAGNVPDPALGLRLAQKYTWNWRLAEMLRCLEDARAKPGKECRLVA